MINISVSGNFLFFQVELIKIKCKYKFMYMQFSIVFFILLNRNNAYVPSNKKIIEIKLVIVNIRYV